MEPSSAAASPQPRLSESSPTNIIHYACQVIEVLDRTIETGQLRAFLDAEAQFTWLQLSGAAGQGKRRMAWDLVQQAKQAGWSAGLLQKEALRAFAANWSTWQPDRPHLMVIEEGVDRDHPVERLLHTLAQRREALEQKVRVLWLARRAPASAPAHTPLGPDGEMHMVLVERYQGGDPALAETAFDDRILTLVGLESSALIDIVRRVAQRSGTHLGLSSADIAQQLAQLDPWGRPLYAYFLGLALAIDSSIQWSHDELLRATLQRDWAERWQVAFDSAVPALDAHPAQRLALLATIMGGLDCEACHESISTDAASRTQARVLVDAPTDTPERFVPALQPDLLGEWFVLATLEDDPSLVSLWDVAWHHAPHAAASFLLKVSQDFPDHHCVSTLLAHAPADAAELVALITTIVDSLGSAAARLPNNILQALQSAAANGAGYANVLLGDYYGAEAADPHDPERAVAWYRRGADAGVGDAMARLGACHAQGLGVELDLQQALHWYRSGAAAGNSKAMRLLGNCLEDGIGLPADAAEAASWYRRAAQMGDWTAMTNLGLCYYRGLGVPRDLEQAAWWLRLAAEAGDGRAMTLLGMCLEQGDKIEEAVYWYQRGAAADHDRAMANLGVCYELGNGVERDLEEALYWYRRGAQAGGGAAMMNLGLCYKNGVGVEPDPVQAVHWFSAGADAGSARSMTMLGVCYGSGFGVACDPAQAVHWYQRGAEEGDVIAMTSLGVCYATGVGVAPDLEQAVQWYQRGAAAGVSSAMVKLGLCYERGAGVEADLEQAVHWYRRGADAGEGEAMTNLGLCYQYGRGLERDPEQAAYWFGLAVEAGYTLAMTLLGECYEHGEGMPSDVERAVHWYRQAAQTGEATAMAHLGSCYHRGLGVETDLQQAAHWYRNGAESGNSSAMINLGTCYRYGDGVAPDLDQAEQWFRRAIDAGDDRALEMLQQIRDGGAASSSQTLH